MSANPTTTAPAPATPATPAPAAPAAPAAAPAYEEPERSREFVDYEPHTNPDGMVVVMPAEAESNERARARILGHYRSCGYRLIDPPIVDSLDSLHSMASPELRNRTVRMTDPEDARPLGIRADITPQIARLDARHMDHNVVQRYAYCGSIIQGLRDNVGARRNPCQIGAELFGSGGLGAEIELISLAIDTCRMMSFEGLVVDLGHFGVFNRLFERSQLHASLRQPLFMLMQNKSINAISEFLAQYSCAEPARPLITQATALYGGKSTLDRARQQLLPDDAIKNDLDHLAQIIEALEANPAIERISVDLVSCNSYSYESGLMFAIYSPQARHPLIRGGRYNDIGGSFGRGRSAVGFSGYLHQLVALNPSQPLEAIYAPSGHADAGLKSAIDKLRAQGEVVVQGLSPEDDATRLDCQRHLLDCDGEWQVRDCVPAS